MTLSKAQHQALWRERHPETANRVNQEWRAKNPEKVKAIKQRFKDNNPEWMKVCAILQKHNLTIDQYHSLQESQDFLCAICGEEVPLCVDHNHETDKVRGLLCNDCNLGLGFFKESGERLQNAQTYLGQ